jgi:geranylgeranyl diphosphate synthase type II
MSTYDAQEDLKIEALLRTMDALILNKLCRADAKKLNDLIIYHFDSNASCARARLALTAGLALGLSDNTCIAIAASCELIHNASLLHDDIQDGDTQRRGKEAAWSRFDKSTAMCAGTLMLSAAFDTIHQSQPDFYRLVSHLHQRTADLICGQTLDLSYAAQPVSLEGYLNIATLKSGSLLALPLELVMIASQQNSALSDATIAGQAFAVAYQIADDLNDVHDDQTRGTCNIISVLEQLHLDKTSATTEAMHVMQTHLLKAETHAAQLPAHSGEFLMSLCGKLSLEEV